jgi:filamentous hemagglutinin
MSDARRNGGLAVAALVLAAWVLAFIHATAALAAPEILWVQPTNGYWDVAVNWSPAHVPTAGEHATIRITGASDQYVFYRNALNPNDTLGIVTIDGTGGGWVQFNTVFADTLKASNLYLGYSGKGKVQHSAGAWSTTGAAYLGYQAGSDGRYTMQGGTLEAGSTLYVGYAGTGIFSQSLGEVTTRGHLRIGYVAGSYGQYSLSGGTLNSGDQAADTVYVGGSGSGSFIHGGGTHHIIGDMKIGDQNSAVGSYAINGSQGMPQAPSLDMQNLVVGSYGEGEFSVNNAGVTVRGNMTLGQYSQGDGTVNVTAVGGPSSMSIGGSVSIGEAGFGTMHISGSTVNVAGALTVGGRGMLRISAGATPTISGKVTVNGEAATLRLEGGFLTCQSLGTAPVVIADSGYGVATHTGGTHVITGDMYIGNLAGSIGDYTMDNSTGSSLLQAHHLFAGKAGNGVFRQNAGNVDLSGSLYVGHGGSSLGKAVFAGGTCDIDGAAWVGVQADGEMTVAGSAAVTVAGNMNLGDSTGSSGSLIVAGGSLSIGGWIMGGFGDSTLTYGGGTLSVGAHNIQVDEIYVKGGPGAEWSTSDAISCRSLRIGDSTAGRLVHTGGILNVSQSVTVDYAGSWVIRGAATDVNVTGDAQILYGSASVEGGRLDVGGRVVVQDATLSHSHGAIAVIGNMDVCGPAGSAYSMLDNVSAIGVPTFQCQDLNIGVSTSGLFSQNGGTVTVAGNMVVGRNAAGNGTLQITETNVLRSTNFTVQGNTEVGKSGYGYVSITEDPAVTFQGNLDIGGPGTGFFEITGPATVAVRENLTVSGLASKLYLGYEGEARGIYVLTDDPAFPGAPEVHGLYAEIGYGAVGAFQQSGGSAQFAQSVSVGRLAGAEGLLSVHGGTFSAGDALHVGRAGHGEMLIGGGSVATGGDLFVASEGGTGVVRMDGGSLNVGGRFNGLAGSTLVYNAGAYADGNATLTVDEFIVTDLSGTNATWTVTGGEAVQTTTTRIGAAGKGAVSAAGLVVCSTPGSTGLVDLRDGTLQVAGTSLLGQGATLKVAAHAAAAFGGPLTLAPGSLLRLTGGEVTLPDAATLRPEGGTFAFDAGRVTLTGPSDLDSTFLGAVLGADQTLVSGQTLRAQSTATLQARLVLDGGRLSVAGLEAGSCLDFRRGTFEVIQGALEISSAGPLGSQVAVLAGQTLAGEGGVNIFGGAAVTMAGGTLDTGGLYVDVSGQLAGTGMVRGGVHIMETGEVRVGAADVLRFVDAMYSMNFGSVRLSGGTLEAGGSLMNQDGAMVSGRGTIIAEGGIQNFGAMTFSSGFTDLYGDVGNWGTIISTGGATVTFFDDVTNDAEIRTSAGCATVFLGALDGAGSFTGAGAVYIEGDLRPGHSPGRVDFSGDLFMGGTATLLAELGGADAGRFDRISVGGCLDLNGRLDVRLLDGYMPAPGAVFDILDWGMLSGSFDAVSLPSLGRGLEWDASALYSTGSLSVLPEPATLALLALGWAVLAARRRRSPRG